MPLLPFAEYAPDQDVLNGQYSATVRNVLPAAQSYIPFHSLQAFTDAVAAKPLNGITVRSLSGTVSSFIGTATKLYKLNNTTLAWDDVSQTAVTYSASTTAKWSFAQFGNYVIAVNINNDPQVFQLGTSTEFADLAGSPPRAAVVKACGDFLFLHQLSSNANRSQWSGLNDIEFWTPGSQSSDYQDFPDGGIVQGSTSATNPIIFMERAIYFATFVPGSTEIFTFQKVHDRRGAKSPHSIAERGVYAFYADEGGFFQISPDGAIASIGREKVDRTTFEDLSAGSIAEIRGVVDPFHSRVYFALDDDADGYFDRILTYDWDLQRWTQADVDVSVIMQAATTGYTLDGLDALGYTMETLPFSLDSKVWQGGAPVLAAFNTSHVMGFFNGSAMEATIDTQEVGSTSGGVTRVQDMMPVIDTNTLYLSIGTRFRRGDSPVWTDETTPSTNTGMVHKRSRARFHRFKVRVPAGTDWEHAQGIDVAPRPAGTR